MPGDETSVHLSDKAQDYLGRIIVPVVVALLVGGFVGWVTVNVTLARFDERLSAVEQADIAHVQRIEEIEARKHVTQKDVQQAKTSAEAYTDRKVAEMAITLARVSEQVSGIQDDVRDIKTDSRETSKAINRLARELAND